jgi:integrase
MRIARKAKHQQGSIRKVKRAQGFAWEYRYYDTVDGVRKPKSSYFSADEYPTEFDVRKAIEPQLKMMNAGTLVGKIQAATLGTVIDRYLKDDTDRGKNRGFLRLSHSTQCTNGSLIELHIRPRFENVRLSEIDDEMVEGWLETKAFGAASKNRAKNLIGTLLTLAMKWKMMPLSVNPMKLVSINNATKRQKRIFVLTHQQFKELVQSLPEPYNLMVLVSGCLGLRVSEVLALKWEDFEGDTVTIWRVYTHGRIKERPKTEESGEPLPVHPGLAALLSHWKAKQDKECNPGGWIFPSPRTGGPYSDSTILTDHIKPAAMKLGIVESRSTKGVGWHTFRHSYKEWMAGKGVAPSVQKDLMRHADIETTMNVYGRSLTSEMRLANAKVVQQLL